MGALVCAVALLLAAPGPAHAATATLQPNTNHASSAGWHAQLGFFGSCSDVGTFGYGMVNEDIDSPNDSICDGTISDHMVRTDAAVGTYTGEHGLSNTPASHGVTTDAVVRVRARKTGSKDGTITVELRDSAGTPLGTATTHTLSTTMTSYSYTLTGLSANKTTMDAARVLTTTTVSGGGGGTEIEVSTINVDITYTLANVAPQTPSLRLPMAGETTSAATPFLTGNITDPDTADLAQMEVEVCDVAMAFNQTCAAAGGVVQFTGLSALAAEPNVMGLATTALADGTWHWHARAIDDDGATSSWTSSRSFTIDSSLAASSTITQLDPATSYPSWSYNAAGCGVTSPALTTLLAAPPLNNAACDATNPASYMFGTGTGWDEVTPADGAVTNAIVTDVLVHVHGRFISGAAPVPDVRFELRSSTGLVLASNLSIFSYDTWSVATVLHANGLGFSPAELDGARIALFHRKLGGIEAQIADVYLEVITMANTAPTVTPTSPSAGTTILPWGSIPVAATFNDVDGHDGAVTFELCDTLPAAGQSCNDAGGTVIATATDTIVDNGTDGTASLANPGTGSYWWLARSTDDYGSTSTWSTGRSITVRDAEMLVPDVPRPGPSTSDWGRRAPGVSACTTNIRSVVSDGSQIDEIIVGGGGSEFCSDISGSDYLMTAGGTDEFELTDVPIGTATVDTVELWVRAMDAQIDPVVTTRLYESDGTLIGITTVDVGSPFTTVSSTFTGLSLTEADLNGLYVQFSVNGLIDPFNDRAFISAINVVAYTNGANAAPDAPVHVSPTNAGSTSDDTPTLTATFSDPDAGDTGAIEFEVCDTAMGAGQSCTAAGGSVLAGGSSPSGITNGADASWTSTTLTPGTVYWHARAIDAPGGATGPWSASWTLTVSAPSVTLTLDSTTVDFGLLMPPSDAIHAVDVTVATASPNGYTLSVRDADGGGALDGPGAVSWFAIGSIATPAAWSGTGLGISAWGGDQTPDRWCLGGQPNCTADDDADLLWAGMTGTSQQVATRDAPTAGDATRIPIRIALGSAQAPGSYSGSVEFTAVGVP